MNIIVSEAVIALNINKTYEEKMPVEHLYECTRGVWKISVRRAEKAEFAFACYQGEVVEIYKILNWSPAGTKKYQYRELSSIEIFNRHEFSGLIASNDVRRKYLGQRSPVRHGQQPVRYINC